MKRFAELYRRIDGTTSTNAKVSAMEEFFRSAPAGDSAWALHLLMDRGRKRYVTSRMIQRYLAERSGLPEWLLEECRAHVGDSAETAALLLRRERMSRGETPEKERELSLSHWM